MEMGEPLGDDWLGRILTALAGAVAAAFVAYFRGRREVEKNLVTAAQDAAHVAIADLTGMIATIRNEMREERRECDAKLAGMKAQIDELMATPVAGYGDKS